MAAAVRRGRTVLPVLAAAALLLQALAFVGARPTPKALRSPRHAEEAEDEILVMPSRMVELRVGQELRGVVTRATDRIALVDIGVEKVALLPGSKMDDMPPQQRKTPEEKYKEGDSISVWVSEVQNAENARESKVVVAGHRNKIINPFTVANQSDIEDVKAVVAAQQEKEEKIFYDAVVHAEKDFGVVAALRIPDVPGIVSGLVYITEVQGTPKVLDKIKVRILEVDGRRVKLSMRETDPLKGAAAGMADFRDLVDETVPCTVNGLADYGAFVDVIAPSGATAKALLPNGEIKDSFVEDPAEELEVGQSFDVKILQIGEKGMRVSKKQAGQTQEAMEA